MNPIWTIFNPEENSEEVLDGNASVNHSIRLF